MLRSLLVLPSGEEIFSGQTGRAVRSTQFSRCVNSGQELTLGSVCAASVKFSLFAPEQLGMQAGDRIRFYQVDDAGNRFDRGIFILEEPVLEGPGIYSVTGYDPVILLDRDLSGWVAGLTGWPYDLNTFAHMVCQACGTELADEVIPGGSCPVHRFSAQGITGRILMKMVAEAAGRYCVAHTDGRLRLGWYTAAPTVIGPAENSAIYDQNSLTLPVTATYADGILTPDNTSASYAENLLELMIGGSRYYYQGSLELADSETVPVERVQIGATAQDVGTVYPDDPGEKNTYRITGNLLLSATKEEDLRSVAENLYEVLSGVTYTGCKLTLPADADVQPGQILWVLSTKGRWARVYVMSVELSGQRLVIRCDGTGRRDSSKVVNHQSFQTLSGKVLELQTDVEGLQAVSRDNGGNLAQLKLELDGISASVQQQNASGESLQSQLSGLRQTASELSLELKTLRQEGASKVVTGMGYSFSDQGLRIGSLTDQIENRLDNTGMFVERSGQILLQADSRGVLARDVTVGNYLVVGDHARFEDYGENRTACFYL